MPNCYGCDVAGYEVKIDGAVVAVHSPTSPPIPNGHTIQHNWNPANGPVITFIVNDPNGGPPEIHNYGISKFTIVTKSGRCVGNAEGDCEQDYGCEVTIRDVFGHEIMPDGSLGPTTALFFDTVVGMSLVTPPGPCGGIPVGLANYRFRSYFGPVVLGSPGTKSEQTIDLMVSCTDCCEDTTPDQGGD